MTAPSTSPTHSNELRAAPADNVLLIASEYTPAFNPVAPACYTW